LIKLTAVYVENSIKDLIDASVLVESADTDYIGGFSINISVGSTSAGIVRSISDAANLGGCDLFVFDLMSGTFSAISVRGQY